MTDPDKQQLTWSRIVHERLYGLCWHEVRWRDMGSVSDRWCPKCKRHEVNGVRLSAKECKTFQKDGYPAPVRYGQMLDGKNLNYCCWELAMPALQKVLLLFGKGKCLSVLWDHLVIYAGVNSAGLDMHEDTISQLMGLIEDMTPESIIRAIAEEWKDA